MFNLSLSFISSFLVTMLIVRYAGMFGKFSMDYDLHGVQKNHTRAVPRVGGIGVVSATCFTCFVGALFGTNPRAETMLLLAVAAPAFCSGLAEDLTKRVSPRVRLLLAMAGAGLGVYLLDAVVVRVDLPLIDAYLVFAPVAIGLTVLTVAGLTHAMNIVDGMNGLASVTAILIFGSIGYVAHEVGDWFVMSVALTMVGAILGFVIWNYPMASVFLGDGGAYFAGFVMAELLVILILRHPNVSAWYAAVVTIYPLFETVFSIYRRRMLKGRPASQPDGLHMHTLIYKRIARRGVYSGHTRRRERGNPTASVYLWAMALIGIVPATLFWQSPLLLACAALAFVAVYLWLYSCIVRFRTPHWLLMGHHEVITASAPDKTRHH
ncbi:MraY family glycosyltransferase [Paraburkholderia sp. 22099]|jgi:UDP-N-acetylmuramyl pentapeptide phosphotransferase/UDP-N-acetylglucosamine-1-phosphate transferase|uniref:MraY family glycosyltransferase n=1 Tax=Paraburkholderia TaxID=1822464 RepID=UPI0028588A1A|nr:glycosyltransferase [Paraburkholderia terricola]MDR6492271.1 UDP-N-acetylmuramyl pentapeptide phosphotransferase/UDP-N-acetylglucosamine-1-phosphate transferase [Paraburkholderia terricola]